MPDTVPVCPDCESTDYQWRTTQHTNECNQCGHLFRQPGERTPQRAPPLVNGNLSAAGKAAAAWGDTDE